MMYNYNIVIDKTIVKYTIENSEIPIALTKYLLKEDLGKQKK